MTLHFSHIVLTLARTFIGAFSILGTELLVAVGDASTGHVVGRDLDLDLVPGQDADAVHAHLPRTVGEDGVPVLELHAEHGVGKRLDDGPLDGERVFLWLTQFLSPCYGTAGRGGARLLHGWTSKACPEVG